MKNKMILMLLLVIAVLTAGIFSANTANAHPVLKCKASVQPVEWLDVDEAAADIFSQAVAFSSEDEVNGCYSPLKYYSYEDCGCEGKVKYRFLTDIILPDHRIVRYVFVDVVVADGNVVCVKTSHWGVLRAVHFLNIKQKNACKHQHHCGCGQVQIPEAAE